MAAEDTTNEFSNNANNTPSESDSTLEALINQEQTLAHDQLEEELGREPTQEETDEWLNAHTESY